MGCKLFTAAYIAPLGTWVKELCTRPANLSHHDTISWRYPKPVQHEKQNNVLSRRALCHKTPKPGKSFEIRDDPIRPPLNVLKCLLPSVELVWKTQQVIDDVGLVGDLLMCHHPENAHLSRTPIVKLDRLWQHKSSRTWIHDIEESVSLACIGSCRIFNPHTVTACPHILLTCCSLTYVVHVDYLTTYHTTVKNSPSVEILKWQVHSTSHGDHRSTILPYIGVGSCSRGVERHKSHHAHVGPTRFNVSYMNTILPPRGVYKNFHAQWLDVLSMVLIYTEF